MVAAGKIRPDTVLRGPTTGQFWSTARRTPGVAGLLGICYACQKTVPIGPGLSADHPNGPAHARPDHCPACGAATGHAPDRQYLGLGPVHLLPGRTQLQRSAHATGQDDNPGARLTSGATPRHTALLIAIVVIAMVAAGGIAAWLLGPASSHQSRSAQRTLPSAPSGTPSIDEPGSKGPSAASDERPQDSTRSSEKDSRNKQGNLGQIGNFGNSEDQSANLLSPAQARSLIEGSRDSIVSLIESPTSDPSSQGNAITDIAHKRLEYLDFREWFNW